MECAVMAPKPASWYIFSSSRKVYASPAAVLANMVKLKAAAMGGEMRSSLGTNSSAAARPPGARAEAGRDAYQHGQADGRGHGRRKAVFIGHEFQRRRAAAGLQCRMHFPQQPDARGRVEMVQEIREQDDVVRSAILDVERAARQKLVAILHARLTRVAARDLQHDRPIYRRNAGFRIQLGHLNAE